MSYEAERAAIYAHFKTQWAAATPIQFENQPFSPPDAGPWVELNILRGQSAAAGLQGGGLVTYRHPAVLQIDVVIEQGKGTKIATNLADQIAAIFRGKSISGLKFQGPELVRIDEKETGRVRFVVSIPFYRDTVFNVS